MTEIIDRLSWSSLNTYMGCGERWRLERVYHLDRSTWYATLAGSAVHEVTEELDRSGEVVDLAGAHERFVKAFDQQIALAKELGQEIKASGRQLKNMGTTGGPNKKDYSWWLVYGPQYVLRWQEFRTDAAWSIAAMDGELNGAPIQRPAIELEFNIELGGTEIRGFIDRVFWDPVTEQYVVVDLKMGNRPSTPLQLAVYRAGLLDQYGLDVRFGAYWCAGEVDEEKGRDGFGVIHDLTTWSRDYMEHLFAQARAGIGAGVFLPTPSNMCGSCSVRHHCRAMGGSAVHSTVLSPLVPIREDVVLVSEDSFLDRG